VLIFFGLQAYIGSVVHSERYN